MCVLTGAFIGLITRFRIMVIDCLPACKLQEARTGNYVLIWSGIRRQRLPNFTAKSEQSMYCMYTGVRELAGH